MKKEQNHENNKEWENEDQLYYSEEKVSNIEIEDNKEKERLNAALGCVIGAFIGDSLGSAEEFQSDVDSQDFIKDLSMDGGKFGNGPGQVTDDSELGLCLSQGLNDTLPKFSLENIANYYRQWIESEPFDIGITTKSALRQLNQKTNRLAQRARLGARNYNKESKSNWSFMRSSPLAVWGRRLKP